jgi:antitoxin PrlF
MLETTMTSKGQTTIPKDIRDGLGIKSGDRMTFTLLPDGTVILRAKTRNIVDLAGVLHQEGMVAVPVENMTPW